MPKQSFEIEEIFHITNRGYIIAARWMTPEQDFTLGSNAKLGGVAITKWMDIPRVVDAHKKQRMDLFVFQLENEEDRDKLDKGQIVLLTYER